MASQPGLLTEWPWTKLGRFKYVVLAPWVAHSIYSFISKDEKERDATSLLIFPSMLWRAIHNQIWVSVSRYRTAKGNNRIVDKSLEFEQVDRESNWDDQILLNAIIFYLGHMFLRGASHFPLWRTDGMILTMMLHAGPVEFIYYWIHRALHHHYLYSRYHSHHHSSIVTEPITSVIHPFAEHIVYFALFAIPLYTMVLTGTKSVGAYFVYITYIDLMNNMGHCNFELVPSWLFRLFPFLKYIMYTPSFHSLHHTQFRTNYSLFMPIYDYIYGTMDKSSNILYEKSLKRKREFPDVVHLTHPTTLDSIYHVRLAFAAQAATPYTTKWYLKIFWPMSYWSSLLASMYNHPFVVERNTLNQLKMQTWVIPRYSYQYGLSWQRKAINNLVEEAILKAEKAGVKVLSLGLLNQDRKLNEYGALYVQKHPNLKIKIVDGSSLAVAIVLNNIPKETQEVLLRGNLCKVGFAIVRALCKNGVQVAMACRDEYEKLKAGGLNIASNFENNLVLSTSYTQKVWLVGDGLKEDEQRKAPKGTLLLPFSTFPPAKIRKDCIYCTPPAMIVPKTLENIDSCENWLPRRVMSAQRVAGIVHALANWEQQECGDTMLNIDEVWDASLRHGFRPLPVPTSSVA